MVHVFTLTSFIFVLMICWKLLILTIAFQRCHDPANGRKCKHVQFKKCGPDNLEAMEIIFESAHVNGSTASIPAVLSDSTDDETVVAEDKVADIGELKVASLKKKKEKKRKAANTIAEEKAKDIGELKLDSLKKKKRREAML